MAILFEGSVALSSTKDLRKELRRFGGVEVVQNVMFAVADAGQGFLDQPRDLIVDVGVELLTEPEMGKWAGGPEHRRQRPGEGQRQASLDG